MNPTHVRAKTPFLPDRFFFAERPLFDTAGPIIPAQESEARNSANKQEVAYISIGATSSFFRFLRGGLVHAGGTAEKKDE